MKGGTHGKQSMKCAPRPLRPRSVPRANFDCRVRPVIVPATNPCGHVALAESIREAAVPIVSVFFWAGLKIVQRGENNLSVVPFRLWQVGVPRGQQGLVDYVWRQPLDIFDDPRRCRR